MSTNVHDMLRECIKTISETLDADLFIYSADIEEENADQVIKIVQAKANKRDNLVLVLATYGGDPDAAFRIARFLQNTYNKFTLFVFGYCKSAGTLVAIGADEIVMSDLAELGPLDIQVAKDDDLVRRSSGLDLQKALTVLSLQGFQIFQQHFIATTVSSGGVVTTKTAADIASSIAVGLLAPIASQIEPLRLGAVYRSMDVAYEYGIRLNPNLKKTVNKLINDYPSHGFVIDRKEAQELFPVVREPSQSEKILEQILYECIRTPSSEKMIFFLDDLLDEDLEDSGDEDFDDEDNEEKKENEQHDENKSTENGRIKGTHSNSEGEISANY
ncbi:hypothetical protein NUACC21_31100 [Scytonema sp. NUACC21]